MPIPILYGSQTGNGIHLAALLEKKFKESFSLPIDTFDMLEINNFPLVIFICSTHGDGQCPFNMSRFYRFILSQSERIFNFDYAVLGLGDSSYPKYNYCAKVLVAKLKQLGGNLILKEFCNSQDENGNYDGLSRFLKSAANSKIGHYMGCNENESESAKYAQTYSIKPSKCIARVVSNSLVTPIDYDKKVFELILDIPGYNDFSPGDCIAIFPKNVITPEQFIASISLDPDSGEKSNVNSTKYTKNEIKCLLSKVDLFSTVQQAVFKDLSAFCKNELYKQKIKELYEDYDLYYNYVVLAKRNLIEIIRDFHLDIPMEYLLSINPIVPRYYSCAKINGLFHILYNEVKYKTYLSAERKGLCSEYLKSVASHSISGTKECSAIAFEQRTNLDDSPNRETNVNFEIEVVKSNLFFNDKKLLIFATGTGITLPRSVIHFFKDKETRIYYGFRHFNVDQLCKEEFQNCEIFYASSRENRKYVMDAYKENPVENIDEWLVFVSGNTRLNKEIRGLLKEIHGKEINFQSETW